MDRSHISSAAFAIASLAAVIGISMLAFPYAAMSPEQAVAARTPQQAELFDDMELGDFGTVSVLDMMQHYVDNPPAEDAAGSSTGKTRFQGC